MASRATNRPGFGSLAGARNSRVIISEVAPRLPLFKDIWINSLTNKMYWYDGAAWQQVVM